MTFANTRVFIGGLEGEVQKEDIEKEFSKFGKLDNVWIAQNPPGFAFIVYESEQDAEEAVKSMNGISFLNSEKIRVEFSKPKRRGFGGPRRGDFGMRGGRGARYGGPNSNQGGYGGYNQGPYNGGGQRFDRRDDRGFGKTNYQSGGYSSARRPREYNSRGNSDRNSSPPRYD